MPYYIGLIGQVPITNTRLAIHPVSGAQISESYTLDVQFRKGGAVPDYAREAVSKLPQFYRGIGLDEDPFTRVSWFDSRVAQDENNWTDTEHDLVVERLDAIAGVDFVRADQPKLAAPWPAYDTLKAQGKRTVEMVAEKIVEKVQEDGYDPGIVLQYERENASRPAVVAALEALIAPTVEAEPEAEVVAA